LESSLYDYDLPREMIAQEKSVPRDSSRLFYVDLSDGIERRDHLRFRDLVGILDEGDLLVLNRSKVLNARIPASKSSGGRAEVLLLEEKGAGWEALIRGKGIKAGSALGTSDPDVTIDVLDRMSEGLSLVRVVRDGSPLNGNTLCRWLDTHGKLPTPPYIRSDLKDPGSYQTIYSRGEGSVAAPTAGLHFTEEVLKLIADKGVNVRHIVLHVGIGTFAPIKTERIEGHIMGSERYSVPKETVAAVEEAAIDPSRPRIWAVGTTVMRTLETAFGPDGRCISPEGRSDLYITPGHRFHLPYKGFITNFHLPRSTPLVLVSAFWDRERVLDAYEEAKGNGYRFYSLGDSMAIRRA